MHPALLPTPLSSVTRSAATARPALLNVLQQGQSAKLQVKTAEAGSVVVDLLYLNQDQRQVGCTLPFVNNLWMDLLCLLASLMLMGSAGLIPSNKN